MQPQLFQIFLKKKIIHQPPLNIGHHLLVPLAHQTDTAQSMSKTSCFIGTLTPGQNPEISVTPGSCLGASGTASEQGPTLLTSTSHSGSSRRTYFRLQPHPVLHPKKHPGWFDPRTRAPAQSCVELTSEARPRAKLPGKGMRVP